VEGKVTLKKSVPFGRGKEIKRRQAGAQPEQRDVEAPTLALKKKRGGGEGRQQIFFGKEGTGGRFPGTNFSHPWRPPGKTDQLQGTYQGKGAALQTRGGGGCANPFGGSKPPFWSKKKGESVKRASRYAVLKKEKENFGIQKATAARTKKKEKEGNRDPSKVTSSTRRGKEKRGESCEKWSAGFLKGKKKPGKPEPRGKKRGREKGGSKTAISGEGKKEKSPCFP